MGGELLMWSLRSADRDDDRREAWSREPVSDSATSAGGRQSSSLESQFPDRGYGPKPVPNASAGPVWCWACLALEASCMPCLRACIGL